MNTPQESQSKTVNEQVVYERCLCRNIVDTVRECLEISPTVRQHLVNSRIEFLKALRQVLDNRIEHLSVQEQKGTKVAVE
jgi:hypothetical protein